MEFDKWQDLCEQVSRDTGGLCLYSGRGICVFSKSPRAVVLRSVDQTFYYADEFVDGNRICFYTCEGKIGDQKLNSVGNINLLVRAERIYIYRVLASGRYLWLGEYVHNPTTVFHSMQHPGEDGQMRKIFRVCLLKKSGV